MFANLCRFCWERANRKAGGRDASLAVLHCARMAVPPHIGGIAMGRKYSRRRGNSSAGASWGNDPLELLLVYLRTAGERITGRIPINLVVLESLHVGATVDAGCVVGYNGI